MEETLTSASFADHVGERFDLAPQEGEPFAAELTSCEETRYGAHAQWREAVGRVPFSLVFTAPGGELVPQQVFTVRHAELGELGIFLVPLGPGETGGMRYEAVFS